MNKKLKAVEASKPSHTPGPWVLSPISPDLIGTVGNGGSIPDGRKLVAQVHGKNRAADAALICAAPDLYAALEAMLTLDDWHDEEISPAALIAKARAAMEKAVAVL